MNEAIEERVAKLEAELNEVKSKLQRAESAPLIATQRVRVRDRVPPEYWAEREADLRQVRLYGSVDSTTAVSADRDAR